MTDAVPTFPPGPPEHIAHPRTVRTFVRRAGRTTFGQARAFEELGPRFLLPYTGAPNDGSAHETKGCKGRVVRGGAWDDHIDVLRSAERFWLGAGNRNNNIGLRVARTLPP